MSRVVPSRAAECCGSCAKSNGITLEMEIILFFCWSVGLLERHRVRIEHMSVGSEGATWLVCSDVNRRMNVLGTSPRSA